MNELTDALCMDLVMYGMETMTHILNVPCANSIVVNSLFLKLFTEKLENRIKEMNLVYCPSSNSFHPVLEIDIPDKSITISEDEPYDSESVRKSILMSGMEVGTIDESFVKTVNDLIDNGENSFEEVYGNYIMYKAYVSHVIYDLIIGFVIKYPETTIPFIDPYEDLSYITLSINLNSWWDSIANKKTEKIRDLTSTEEKYIIPWIRPTIVVRPDMSFRFSNITLVDMAPIFLKNGTE